MKMIGRILLANTLVAALACLALAVPSSFAQLASSMAMATDAGYNNDAYTATMVLAMILLVILGAEVLFFSRYEE
jgi:hypothetical protein